MFDLHVIFAKTVGWALVCITVVVIQTWQETSEDNVKSQALKGLGKTLFKGKFNLTESLYQEAKDLGEIHEFHEGGILKACWQMSSDMSSKSKSNKNLGDRQYIFQCIVVRQTQASQFTITKCYESSMCTTTCDLDSLLGVCGLLV